MSGNDSRVYAEDKERGSSIGSVATSNRSSAGSEDNEKREEWTGTLDFILSCIGYAVGLGNLVRFPYICGRNGGATFLIPYLIMMTFAGLPTFYLELVLGQFGKVSPWILYRRMCPIFTGLGQSMVLISLFTGIYYNVYMAWALRYLYACIYNSIAGNGLPFSGCRHPYNSALCIDADVFYDCYNQSLPGQTDYYYDMGECVNATTSNWTQAKIENVTANIKLIYVGEQGVLPGQEYNDYVLGHPRDAPLVSEWGVPKWDLVVALFIAWVLVFLVLCKGVKSSGKVVYFTATFPYLLLLVLLVSGNLLPNSHDGIMFYMKPNVTKLKEIQPWTDAATQIFFSLSVGGGRLTTLASYNDFSTNILRDTLIVVFGNCLTSFFAGFVIFPILGYEAQRIYPNMEVNARVLKLAAGGPSLAYIAYPGGLAEISPPWLWSLLFFFMLILLGIDSELVIVEVVITTVLDQFPFLKSNWKLKTSAVGGTCAVMFLAGLVLVTPSGVELINLVDTFAGGWTLLIGCLCEILMVSYLYGIRRWLADIHCMLGYPTTTLKKIVGYPVNPFWWLCWLIVTPALLIFILVFSFIDYQLKFNGKLYPTWAADLGFAIFGFIIVWTPLMAIVMVVRKFSQGKPWSWLISPSKDWGPPDMKNRKLILREHPYYNGERAFNGFRGGPTNVGREKDNLTGWSARKHTTNNVTVLSMKKLDKF